MGLLDLLPGSKLGLQGGTPANIPSSKNTSTLHFQSSINDNPDIDQSPSALDLNGDKPAVSATGQKLPYMSNLPK